MAKDQSNNTSGEVTAGTESWDDDIRSLPLYNVEACKGAAVRGYLVDVQILGKEENSFAAMVVRLTAPTLAKLNEEVVSVEAGREIFLRGADLRDLDRVALHPDFVREYLLTPRRHAAGSKIPEGQIVKDGILHLKGKPPKQPMPLWDRKVNPKIFKREDVCPNRRAVLPAAQVHTLLLAQKAGEDASFDPADMKH